MNWHDPQPAFAAASDRPCKICGSTCKVCFSLPNSLAGPSSLKILRCDNCALLFVGDTVSIDDLVRAYEAVDWKGFYSQVATDTEKKASQAAGELLPLMSRMGQDPVAVLDIGCGYGHFLEAVRRRFPAALLAGFEIQQQSVAACRARGFTMYTGSLESVEGRYSVVSLLDVAEHLSDPLETFRLCASLLQRQGYVYIHTPRCCFWDNFFLRLIRMPGFRRLSLLWFQSRLSIFHLQLWTEKALSLCLQRSGLTVVDMRATRELSCPVRAYIAASLGDRCSRPALSVATFLATVLFVWLGTLKNKAICLARLQPEDANNAAAPLEAVNAEGGDSS